MKVVLAAVLFAAPIAVAELEVERVPLSFPCLDQECTHIAVPAPVMDAIADSNAKLAQEVKALQARIKEPKCAAVEVVPKKKLPPLKTENNS